MSGTRDDGSEDGTMSEETMGAAVNEAGEEPGAGEGQRLDGSYFPYESQSEHWKVDFSDSSKVYEGTALPIWLLAGWAAFIIWAVLYLIAGLPTAF
jgi:hypothetical protein